MSVAFRNVVVDRDSPVESWPFEAIVTVIERGTIGDWVRLTEAIDQDPWGGVARQIEDYLSYESPYGVGPPLVRAIARARRAAEEEERAVVAAEVAELIASSGLTVGEMAARAGTSRSRLSTYRSGKVMPSAAMMVRLRRVAERTRPGSEEGNPV